ncbi:Ras-related protein RabA5c-like protein [Tanacetum coccineum]
MLVGNKCELDNIRAVSVEDGKNLAEKHKLLIMETTALDSTNVKTTFKMVIKEIYNNVSQNVLNSDSYKAELSVNRVTLSNNGKGGSKQDNMQVAFSLVLHSGVASSWIYAAMAGVNCWLISGAGGVIISGVGKASDGGTNGLKSASRLKSGWPGLAPCQSGIEKYGLCLLVLLMRMGDSTCLCPLCRLLRRYSI